MRKRTDGFVLAVVLLVAAVALGALVTTASLSALSTRTVSSGERDSALALLAAESSLNTVLARSATTDFAYDDSVYSSVQAWLTGEGLSSRTLPNGATATLDVVGPEGVTVTLRAVGTSPNGATRTIFQDFVIDSTSFDPTLVADGALITTEALVTNSKKSRLVGLGLDPTDWEFPDRRLSDARVDEYLRYTWDGTDYDLIVSERNEDTGQAKVEDYDGNAYNIASDGSISPVGVDDTHDFSPAATAPITLYPFALSADVTLGGVGVATTLNVTNADRFDVGSDIAVGDCLVEIDSIDVDAGQLTVKRVSDGDYWCDEPALTEGSAVRRIIPSAVAEGGCPEPSEKLDEKLPQGCVVEPLGDLWVSTFGESKSEMLTLFQDEGSYYSGGGWPTTVSGLTWIDGAKTKGKNNALCGDGVVVLNTGSSLEDEPDRINLTTADCEFRGVLYVIGKLKLVGNLDNFTGAVLTEGPGDTEMQGNGDKSLYDPIVVRNALDNLPPFTEDNGLFGALANTYRFGR